VFTYLKDVKGTSRDEMRKRLIEKTGDLLIQVAGLSSDLPPIYQKRYHALNSGTPDEATLKASL
jgi:hypothetical protein